MKIAPAPFSDDAGRGFTPHAGDKIAERPGGVNRRFLRPGIPGQARPRACSFSNLPARRSHPPGDRGPGEGETVDKERRIRFRSRLPEDERIIGNARNGTSSKGRGPVDQRGRNAAEKRSGKSGPDGRSRRFFRKGWAIGNFITAAFTGPGDFSLRPAPSFPAWKKKAERSRWPSCWPATSGTPPATARPIRSRRLRSSNSSWRLRGKKRSSGGS